MRSAFSWRSGCRASADDLARGPTRLLPCAATLNGEDDMSRALVTSLAAFAAFAFGPVDASAQGLVTMQKLSASLANELVGEPVAACAQKGYTVTAVVVDLDGVRQALLRGNGAPIHTLDNAFYKAYSAASLIVGRRENSTQQVPERIGKHRPTRVPRTHVLLSCVHALTRHPAILDAVEDLIGRDILVYTSTWFIKEPRTRPTSGCARTCT